MFTSEEWKVKIEEFKNSGMTQMAWCKAQGIKYHLLKYYLYPPKKRKSSMTEPLFKELKTSDSSPIKIKWQNISIEISPDFDEITLKRLLRALV